MAAGDGSTDAENGVKMAARDRFSGAEAEPAGSAWAKPRRLRLRAGGPGAAQGAGTEDARGQAAGPADPRDAQADAGPAAAAREAPGQAQPAAGQDGTGLEIYGDSAYGTGAARAAYAQGGHDTVIKAQAAACPAVPGRVHPRRLRHRRAGRHGRGPGGHTRTHEPPKRTVSFGAVCADCPLRARCTTAKDGRSMSIH